MRNWCTMKTEAIQNCLLCHTTPTPDELGPNDGANYYRKIGAETAKYMCMLLKLDNTKYLNEFQHFSCCRKCWSSFELVKLYLDQIAHIRKQLAELRMKVETDLKSTFFHYLAVPEANELEAGVNKFREGLLTDLQIILKVETIGLGLIEETAGAEQVVILEGFDTAEIAQEVPADDDSPFGDDFDTGPEQDEITEFTFGPMVVPTDATFPEKKQEVNSVPVSTEPMDIEIPRPSSEVPASTSKPVPNGPWVFLKKLSKRKLEQWASSDPEERKKAMEEHKKEEKYLRVTRSITKRLSMRKLIPGKLKCAYDNCKTTFTSEPIRQRHLNYVHKVPDYLHPDKTPVENTPFSVEIGGFDKNIVEDGGKILLCPYDNCYARYTLNDRLKNHIRHSHEGAIGVPISCEVENCGAVFATYRHREIHNRRVHLRVAPYPCHCGAEFRTRKEYHEHYSENHSREIACRRCFKSFKTREELNAHRRETHPSVVMNARKNAFTPAREPFVPDNEQMFLERNPGIATMDPLNPSKVAFYTCPTCSKIFQEWKKARRHLGIHTERKIKCPHCPKSFPTQSTIQRHLVVHTRERNYICVSCGKGYLTSVELRKHEQWHCPGTRNESNYKQFQCVQCGKRYQTREILDRHIKEHAGLIVKKPGVLTKCELCDYQSYNSALVRYHQLTHKDEFPFPCDKCDKKFRFQRHLKWHVRLRHENIGRYNCDECGYKTNSKQAFLDHQTKHTNEFPHVCELCGNKYKRLNHLRRHNSEKHTGAASKVSAGPAKRGRKAKLQPKDDNIVE